MSNNSKIYPHVIPEITDWPIHKLLADRRNFVKEIDEYTYNKLLKLYGDQLPDLIAKTVYLERIRIKEEPWKVDPPNERMFWNKIRKKLLGKAHSMSEENQKKNSEEVLKTILRRYSEEIVGTFKKSTFLFARQFLKMFFRRLLNTAAGRNMKRVFGTKYHINERLLAKGEVEKIRSLIKKGTVIVVPTHSSNLDSILIGYAMDSILGLPSFSYGAGLNLYNTGYTAYFMNRLGAYRVDRRKKNPIYLETLKGMSNLSIQRGTNSLFFPGGTRSRSGEIESKLKLGLMGTAMEAQRANYQKGKSDKVFIVPLIISYHVVLEAKFLIENYLKRIGKERYLKGRDEFYSIRKLFKFAWNFFSQPSKITLSFGKPLDVLGNFVDENGVSYDRKGNPVEVIEYFMTGGKVVEDNQRESEYTKMLASRIASRFSKENIVLSSHVVAFAAFNILKKEYPELDLFGILRLPTDDFVFDMENMRLVTQQLCQTLIRMSENGQVKLSEEIYLDVDELIEDGVRNIGIYHPDKTLAFNKQGKLISQDFKLLFFYHNRLVNYGLEKTIDWTQPIKKLEPEMEVAV